MFLFIYTSKVFFQNGDRVLRYYGHVALVYDSSAMIHNNDGYCEFLQSKCKGKVSLSEPALW